MVAEYLARLGVGNLVFIDPDEIEGSNLSRVVGATQVDVETGQLKTQIAVRHAREMATHATLQPVADDVSRRSVAQCCAIATSSSWLPTPCELDLSLMRLPTSTLFLRYRWAQKYGRAIAATSKTPCVRFATSGRALAAFGAMD